MLLTATTAIIKMAPISHPLASIAHGEETPPRGGTQSLAMARPRLPFSS